MLFDDELRLSSGGLPSLAFLARGGFLPPSQVFVGTEVAPPAPDSVGTVAPRVSDAWSGEPSTAAFRFLFLTICGETVAACSRAISSNVLAEALSVCYWGIVRQPNAMSNDVDFKPLLYCAAAKYIATRRVVAPVHASDEPTRNTVRYLVYRTRHHHINMG